MGHFCRFCGRIRANEKFSGSGHRQRICRDCKHIPKDEREAILHREEIRGFLGQSVVSKKNRDRLKILADSPDAEARRSAELVLEVAQIAPGKRNRLKKLARLRPDLVAALEEDGRIVAGMHY